MDAGPRKQPTLIRIRLSLFLNHGLLSHQLWEDGRRLSRRPEQSALLNNDIVRQQEYSVMKPPPVDERFKGLYAQVRASIAAGAVAFSGDRQHCSLRGEKHA